MKTAVLDATTLVPNDASSQQIHSSQHLNPREPKVRSHVTDAPEQDTHQVPASSEKNVVITVTK